MQENTNIGLYNMCAREFLGYDHPLESVEELGIDRAEYERGLRFFETLNAGLANRALAHMRDNAIIITPEMPSKDLVEYFTKVFNLNQNSMLFVSPKFLDEDDLALNILEDDASMDKVRKHLSCIGTPGVIHPRSLTENSVTLAEVLDVSHLHIPPDGYGFEQGVFPNQEYLKNNPVKILNSKVSNHLLLNDLRAQLGDKLILEGGVAEGLKSAVDIVLKLHRAGKDVIIKADRSADGMGNLIVKRSEVRGLESDELKNYLARKLKQRAIPLGNAAPVVVTEFVGGEQEYDYSIDVYCPPNSITPVFAYDSGMLIKQMAFTGLIIPDPLINARTLSTETLSHFNLPIEIATHRDFPEAIRMARKVVVEFYKRRMKQGYVGIGDSDLKICIKNGELIIKILEFNYGRENGGTLNNRLSERLCPGGVAIARDSVSGNVFARPLSQIVSLLEEKDIHFDMRTKEGIVVVGHTPGKGIMSLTVAKDLETAVRIDMELMKLQR